jgi:YggT family protein
MYAVGYAIELVLWTYLVVLLARLVADWVQYFARSWQPTGFKLVMLEVIYTLTDPPIRLFRRFIPPLRIGAGAIDLSMLFVILIVIIARFANSELLLEA